MKIVNFRFDSIEAKRFVNPETISGEIRIDNNITLITVKAIDEDKIEIVFRYTAIYNGVGMITIEGQMSLECNAKEIETEWKSKKRLPSEIAQIVHTTVFNNCVLESIILSRDVGLPPPIPPPSIMLTSGQSKEKSEKTKNLGYF